MTHSYTNMWIHAVWSTKERHALISDNHEKRIYDFLRDQFLEMDCPVRIINGMPDHVHTLFMLSPQKSLAEVMKQVKGSSAHAINQNNWSLEKFSWQSGYSAFSVSHGQLERVFHYINHQKQHHQKNHSRKNWMIF